MPASVFQQENDNETVAQKNSCEFERCTNAFSHFCCLPIDDADFNDMCSYCVVQVNSQRRATFSSYHCLIEFDHSLIDVE
jgi:hypothetical protein